MVNCRLKISLFLFFSIGLCTIHVHILAQENPWEENKQKDGITVESREREADKTKEFKAQMVVNFPVSFLVEVIKTDSLGTQWINRAVKFETLEIRDSTEWYSYTEIAIPWPFLNKDLITHNKLSYKTSDGSVVISMIAEPTFIPEKEGLSRLQHSVGTWRFTPLQNNKTQVEYEVYARSSGGLPAWIVNPIIVQGLYVTLRDLRNVLQENSK